MPRICEKRPSYLIAFDKILLISMILDNKSRIDNDFVWKIIHEAHLSSKKWLIVLHNGDLLDKNLGVTIPKCLLQFCPGEKVFNPYN